ncbi:hypothetical protein [Candidatus Uabimicrobium sp. HlEnr_7]|uniref:hypothetical protein n=1 Tax=Candidatus Uabimicrobium helgolandensis TaxID=3095367 RepID=UPI00355778CA
MSNYRKQLHNTLRFSRLRYIFQCFVSDMSDVIIAMGTATIMISLGLYYADHFDIVKLSTPRTAVVFFGLMVVITSLTYAVWQTIFHMPTMQEIVDKIDKQAGMEEQLLYSYDFLQDDQDVVLKYVARKVCSEKNKWQKYPRVATGKNLIKSLVLVGVWGILFFTLFSPGLNSILLPKIAHHKKQVVQNDTDKKKQQPKKKQQSKKKQQPKKKQQKKQEQKKQQQSNNKKQRKQPSPTKQPNNKQAKKQSQKKLKNPKSKNKNKQPQGGKGTGNKKDKKKVANLPKAKPKKEKVSSLFSDGKDVDFRANVGTEKGASDIEMFHRNFKQLPIYFQKQFLSPEDKMAIKRYFNMIRPSRNLKNN